MDGALSAVERVGGQYYPKPSLAQQVGSSQEPRTLHPSCWQFRLEALPCTQLLHQPIGPIGIRLCCLASRRRLSQHSNPASYRSQLQAVLPPPRQLSPMPCAPCHHTTLCCHTTKQLAPAPKLYDHPPTPLAQKCCHSYRIRKGQPCSQ